MALRADQAVNLVAVENFSETSEDESDDTESDASQDDPTFTEALSGLSRLSVWKKRTTSSSARAKSTSRRLESSDPSEVEDMDVADELDEVDKKSFECVESLIRGGKLDKLKVDQCKVYLRKYGLRLTGNKDTLIQRISEHVRILNGGGERDFPPSSFVLNCKGDACMGDVVMFEQRVYAPYDLASRRGPPIGMRIIAGRIVNESYGAAKQQHTFTIEVLWSKGEKPLPPLHPLLIKGRNLYRMKTLRQRWEDETLRERALKDKHLRGEAARTDREMRIHEKKMKKEIREKRLPIISKFNKDQAPSRLPPTILQQHNIKKHPSAAHNEQSITQHDTVVDVRLEPRNIPGQQKYQSALKQNAQLKHPMMDSLLSRSARGGSPVHRGFQNVNDRVHHRHFGSFLSVGYQYHHPGHPDKGSVKTVRSDHGMARHPPTRWESNARRFSKPASPRFEQHAWRNFQDHARQPCWYFAQGKCHFGSHCKFAHD